jgi:ribosomal protein S18 acetylase RimI-like enzyme
MNQILADLSEVALINAIETNLFELIKFKSLWPRAEVHDDPDLLWCLTDVPFPSFNSVMRAQFPPEQVETIIQGIINRGKMRNVPILWCTTQSTRPSTLGKDLIARGFVFTGEDPGMAVDLWKVEEQLQIPVGFTVGQIHDTEALMTWCQIICSGCELPDFVTDAFFDLYNSVGLGTNSCMKFFLGLLKGEPVAASMLFLGAGVAGIYNVVTTPETRGQGIGTAMTLAPILEARGIGYRVGVLTSSEMGFGVYRRLGFQEICKSGNYEWSGKMTEEKGSANI